MRCPPPWEMVLVVESDTDLGKMLAGTMSRSCVFFRFLWLYCQANTAHSSIVIWLQREIPRLPHSGWLTSPWICFPFQASIIRESPLPLGEPTRLARSDKPSFPSHPGNS